MSAAPAAESPTGVVVGRYQGTVMVTVHGALEPPKVAHLRLLLSDLIEGQGNVSVVVDLQDATPPADDPGGVEVFADETTSTHGLHAVVVFAPPASEFSPGRASDGLIE